MRGIRRTITVNPECKSNIWNRKTKPIERVKFINCIRGVELSMHDGECRTTCFAQRARAQPTKKESAMRSHRSFSPPSHLVAPAEVNRMYATPSTS